MQQGKVEEVLPHYCKVELEVQVPYLVTTDGDK